MAHRYGSVTRALGSCPVAFVAGALLALLGGGLAPLLWGLTRSPEAVGLIADRYVWSIAAFTLEQAALSAILSVGLAIPVARALGRQTSFPGRRAVLLLFTMPLALPALVAVLGIVTVFGRAGWIAYVLSCAGVAVEPPIYGLAGILLAHVYFNLPFAVLLLLDRLEAVPDDVLRLAAQLCFGPGARWRHIEWPALRAALPGALAIVFLICVTSFTVVLTLGGGPAATTLEVAIYQALRFDFDPPRAVLLAVLQMGLCLVLVLALQRFGSRGPSTLGLGRAVRRRRPHGSVATLLDAIVVAIAALYIGLPVLAVAVAGCTPALLRLMADGSVLAAMTTSLAIAATSCAFSLAAAGIFVSAARRRTGTGRISRALSHGSGSLLVVPPFVLGAGWFLLLNAAGLAFPLAPVAVVMANTIMTLPYALRILSLADGAATADHHRLCDSLGLAGWARLRLIDWPMLRPTIVFAGALTAALSLGDLGIAALFGSQRFATLPLLLQQRMGSYRSSDGAALAFLLLLMCLLLFAAAGHIARANTARGSA